MGAITKCLKDVKYKLSTSDQQELKRWTENYSFADLNAVSKDAAMGPIRDI